LKAVVRPARRDDCINFIDIHCPELRRHARKERLAKCGWWGDEEACVFLLRLYRGLGGEVFVAEVSNEVVGEVEVLPHSDCLLGPRAYVNVLWVKEGFRGKGVGRALVGEAVEWARNKGFEALDTIPEEGSEGFYGRLGFERVATQCKAMVRAGEAGGKAPAGVRGVHAQDVPAGMLLAAGTYRPGLFTWFAAWFDTFTRRHHPIAYEVTDPEVGGGPWVLLLDRFSRRGASAVVFTRGKPGCGEVEAMARAVAEAASASGINQVFIQTWREYAGALRRAGYSVLRVDVPWLSLRL